MAQLLIISEGGCSCCNLAGDLLCNTFYLYINTQSPFNVFVPFPNAMSHAWDTILFLLTKQTLLRLIQLRNNQLFIKANCSAPRFPTVVLSRHCKPLLHFTFPVMH